MFFAKSTPARWSVNMSGSVTLPFVMVAMKPPMPLVNTGRQKRMPTTPWLRGAARDENHKLVDAARTS